MSLHQVYFIAKPFASCWEDVDTGAQDENLTDIITILQHSSIVSCCEVMLQHLHFISRRMGRPMVDWYSFLP